MRCPSSLLGAACAARLAAGCYDWQLGPAAPDASGGGGSDATMDARAHSDGSSDSARIDAAHGDDASEDVRADGVAVDAPQDRGAPGDGASCTTLLADVQQAREGAIACTFAPSDCATSVADPCGCRVFVASATSAATAAYVTAVAKVHAAGCSPSCGTCPVGAWACLETHGDAGFVLACTP